MGWQKITFSISWAPKWLKYHKCQLELKVTKKDAALSLEKTRSSLTQFLQQVYAWRLQYVLAHGRYMELETTLTPSRVLSLDEIGLFLEPNSKGAFTVLLCTSASGHIHLALAKRAVRVAVISGAMDRKDALFEISDRTRLPAFDSAVVTAALQGTSLRPRS